MICDYVQRMNLASLFVSQMLGDMSEAITVSGNVTVAGSSKRTGMDNTDRRRHSSSTWTGYYTHRVILLHSHAVEEFHETRAALIHILPVGRRDEGQDKVVLAFSHHAHTG